MSAELQAAIAVLATWEREARFGEVRLFFRHGELQRVEEVHSRAAGDLTGRTKRETLAGK